MNNHRRAVLLIFFLFISISLCFSSSGDWWDGLIMYEFRYTGLQNVKEKTVDKVLVRYLGEPFSDSLFAEMTNDLYAEPWLSYVYADALRDDRENLVIQFNIFENPMIEEVVFNGVEKAKLRVVQDNQEYASGGFFTPGRIKANAESVKDYYLSVGYWDAEVSCKYEENTEDNTVKIIYDINEGKRYRVRDIVFVGNNGISAKDISKVLTQKEKGFLRNGNFVESNIDVDKNAILSLYGSRGYPDAKIVESKIDIDEEDSGDNVYITITYVIDEGEKWTLGGISFSGNEVFSDDEISSVITVHSGDSFNIEKIGEAFNNLSSLYFDNGYIRCSMDLKEERDESTHTISYHLDISEGPQSVVEEVIIEGLTKSHEYVFRREVTLKEGEIFSRAKLIKSQQNIMNTGLISGINADLLYGETENGVIVELEIEEGNQMELQFGATFGGTIDEFPISAFVSWTDKNLLGTGKKLSISSTLSPDTQSITLSLANGWVGDRRWSNTVSLTFEHSDKDNTLQRGLGSAYYDGRDDNYRTYPKGYSSPESWYSSDYSVYPTQAYMMEYDYWKFALGYSTGYTFQFDAGNLTLSVGASFGINRAFYDGNKYDPYEYLILKYHDAWQWSNKLMFGITWDGRDLIVDTTKGYLFSLSYTYAGGFLGGLSNYNRLSGTAAGFVSLFSYVNDENVRRNLVLSLTTTCSFMFDQFWNNTDSLGGGNGWGWYNAKQGATKYEMLYIDGMNIGRGFDVVYDKSFLWNNELALAYPLVNQVVSLEAYISATGVLKSLDELSKFTNIDWYFSMGAGLKMMIPGFPLGLYIVKNATWTEQKGFEWESGYLFSNGSAGSGLKLVLAITTSLY